MAHIREDQYIRDFITQRNNNIDIAYQDLILNIVTAFRTAAVGTVFDIDYTLPVIKSWTNMTPVYFDPTVNTNPAPQIPNIIQDLQPNICLSISVDGKIPIIIIYPRITIHESQ